MLITEETEEYEKALKEGRREYRECIIRRIDPNPLVLDDMLGISISKNEAGVL